MENLETLENQEIELTKTELQECDSHEFACDNLTKAAMIAPEIQSIPAPIAAKNPKIGLPKISRGVNFCTPKQPNSLD